MKIITEERDIIKHGITGERKFKIDGTAKAFKILSDGLYSNKILAVIRELACNAKDSHIDAGKDDIPFEVHLPNSLESYFAVIDHGVGLSNDDIVNMYSTYFASTKTDSNYVTGCLGLGSKSPFAYVDSFTVESNFDGKFTMFMCYYDKEGIPAISMVKPGPVDTDAENGITVKMAVKDGDMREFATTAVTALKRFDPTPIVTGNTDYEIETVEYMVEGTDWKMIKGDGYGYGGVNAIQGNVTYPIDRHALSDLTDAQRSIFDISVDIFFDIGDLDVAANREALGYDEKTIANIIERLDVIVEELPPLFQTKFDDCKTLWEARILFKEVTNELPRGLTSILADKDIGLKWHKQSLNDAFVLDVETYKESMVRFQNGHRSNRGKTVERNHYDSGIKFVASPTIQFFFDDIGNGSHSRVTHYLDENASHTIRDIYLIKTDEKKILKKYSKGLGNVILQPVSNLPKRPKAERSARRVTSKVLEYTGRAHDRRDSWNPTDLDLKDGGIYVMINRFKVYDGDWEMHNFHDIITLAQDNDIIDLTDITIYGIRKGDVAKLPEGAKWINLFDHIRDAVKTVIKKEKVAKVLANAEAFSNFTFELYPVETELLIENFEKGSPMFIFMKAYVYMKKQGSSRANSIQSVASKVRFEIKDSTPKHNLDELWKIVDAQYPLIKLLDDHKMRGGYYASEGGKKEDNYKALIDYMTAIDLTSEDRADSELRAIADQIAADAIAEKEIALA